MVSAPGGESAVVSPPVVSPPGDELAGNLVLHNGTFSLNINISLVLSNLC